MKELPFELNPTLGTLPVYQPGRPIEDVARELGMPFDGIIKLASNENPLGPSPLAVEAMRQAVGRMHLYPDGNAYYLKHRLAAKLSVDPSHLVLGNGSNEIIELLGHVLLTPGAEVVVSEYCFAVYPIVTRLFGASLVTVPARDYGHDLAAMAAAVTPATRVVFVANPNNPTGTLATTESVRQLIEALPKSVVLVLDEAYVEFLESAGNWLAEVRARRPNMILLRTFSKIYGLAGLRVGYGIGHPDLTAALEKVRQPFNLNAMAQAAALAALEDDDHLARTRSNNRTGLSLLSAACRRLNLEHIPSVANFILVRVGDGAEIVAALQRLGIITRAMGGYGLPEWIRVTVGTPEENLRCIQGLESVCGGSVEMNALSSGHRETH